MTARCVGFIEVLDVLGNFVDCFTFNDEAGKAKAIEKAKVLVTKGLHRHWREVAA